MVESQDNKPQDDNEPWVGTPWVLEHYNREQPWHYRELQKNPSFPKPVKLNDRLWWKPSWFVIYDIAMTILGLAEEPDREHLRELFPLGPQRSYRTRLRPRRERAQAARQVAAEANASAPQISREVSPAGGGSRSNRWQQHGGKDET
jgi:predicted DNA-binding transcriptional regulator AlpA